MTTKAETLCTTPHCGYVEYVPCETCGGMVGVCRCGCSDHPCCGQPRPAYDPFRIHRPDETRGR